VPENPELELPALGLPLRQFEDLQVNSNNASESGKGDEAGNNDTYNVPGDVEMESAETFTHPPSPDTGIEEDIHEDQPVLLLPIDILITTPFAEEQDPEEPNEDGMRQEIQIAPPLDMERTSVDEEPDRSYYQQQSQAALCRTMSHILAHVLPLISTCISS